MNNTSNPIPPNADSAWAYYAELNAAISAGDAAPVPSHSHPDTAVHIPEDDPAFPGEYKPVDRSVNRHVNIDPSTYVANVNPYTTSMHKVHMALGAMMRFDPAGRPRAISLRDLRIAVGAGLHHASSNRLLRARKAGPGLGYGYTSGYLLSGAAVVKLERWLVSKGWAARATTEDAGRDTLADLADLAHAPSVQEILAHEKTLSREELRAARRRAVQEAKLEAARLGVPYVKPVMDQRTRAGRQRVKKGGGGGSGGGGGGGGRLSVTQKMNSLIRITEKGIVTFGLVHAWMGEWWKKMDAEIQAKLGA